MHKVLIIGAGAQGNVISGVLAQAAAFGLMIVKATVSLFTHQSMTLI